MLLAEIFEIAADAFEEGRDVHSILEQAGDAACWYWIIGPERGRQKPVSAIQGFTFWIGRNNRIRAVWRSEVAEDFIAYQNLAAEMEFAKTIADQIAAEINRQVTDSICDRPPPGWHCALERGHPGPCPAWPSTISVDVKV